MLTSRIVEILGQKEFELYFQQGITIANKGEGIDYPLREKRIIDDISQLQMELGRAVMNGDKQEIEEAIKMVARYEAILTGMKSTLEL